MQQIPSEKLQFAALTVRNSILNTLLYDVELSKQGAIFDFKNRIENPGKTN